MPDIATAATATSVQARTPGSKALGYYLGSGGVKVDCLFDLSGFLQASASGIYDGAANYMVLAAGAAIDFANFSGAVLIDAQNSGSVSLYLCGGANIALVGTSAGSFGSWSYVPAIPAYRFTNSTDSAVPLSFMAFKLRDYT